jgi:putative chitinase
VITTEMLRTLFPNCRDPGAWARVLKPAMVEFAILSKESVAAFLAQIGKESAELNVLSENLNYSARGLVATWPHRFPSIEFASKYARQPEKIANFVYANRLGNGPAESGDGWRFRGRGLIQLTGRTNYELASRELGGSLLTMPNKLTDPVWAARTAAWFWSVNRLDAVAHDVAAVTKRVTGADSGLAERTVYWQHALDLLGGRRAVA